MINIKQYISTILEPAYKEIGMCSDDALYLMLRTALTESRLTHLRQIGGGPGIGFFQVELATMYDVYRYLNKRKDIEEKVLAHLGYNKLPLNAYVMAQNLALNAIIARIKYWMIPESIPSYKDIEAQAKYWKKYYNTKNGAGKPTDFIVVSECTINII